MRKIVASTTIAASVIGGGAGALILGPSFAGARDDPGPDIEEPTLALLQDTDDPDSGEQGAADQDTDGSPGARSERLAEILGDLVGDGTLTQEQADAVQDAIESAVADGRLGPGGRHAAGRHRGGHVGEILDELGLDADVVREGIADGLTLGEIAEANGSSAEAVAGAIVEHMTERLDAAVDAGRIDEDEAAEMAAEIEERAEAIVNGEIDLTDRGRGRFGERFRGHSHHDDADSDGDDTEGSST